ncbi:putative amidase [Aeropyrum pernix]|uniref:Putative amidase n=1 Tax=Aeropyrum pernix TaxID=56636 RepID=A0A401H914_AERPX|nr:amidase [Aeropyrum pernix]GBF08880.1 putative amidase [Aeropyrum pernix]
MGSLESAAASLGEGVRYSSKLLDSALENGLKLLRAREPGGGASGVCRQLERLNASITCRSGLEDRSPDGLLSYKDTYPLPGEPAGWGTGLPLDTGGEPQVLKALTTGGFEPYARTSMDILALGTSGFNPVLGDILNPRNPRYTTGGSSGGAAASALLAPGLLALASDAGGSVRIPAGYTGVLGLKLRRIDYRGYRGMAPSVEAPGLLSLSMTTLVRGLEALGYRGVGERVALAAGAAAEGLARITLLTPEDLGLLCREALDPGACSAFEEQVEAARSSGSFLIAAMKLHSLYKTLEPPRAVVTLAEAADWAGKFCREECVSRLPERLKGLLRLGGMLRPWREEAARVLERVRTSAQIPGSAVLATPAVATGGCIPVEEAGGLAYTRRAIVFTSLANTLDLYSLSIPLGPSRLDCGAPAPLLLSSRSLEALLAVALLLPYRAEAIH